MVGLSGDPSADLWCVEGELLVSVATVGFV